MTEHAHDDDASTRPRTRAASGAAGGVATGTAAGVASGAAAGAATDDAAAAHPPGARRTLLRRALRSTAALAALTGAAGPVLRPRTAAAQTTGPSQTVAPVPGWPGRAVRMLVGSAPGGGTDAMARAVADALPALWKQPVVVENRPGASNTLASDATAKSTDGLTMVMGVNSAQVIAPHLIRLGYDTNRDLAPVAFVAEVPNVLVVNPQVPARSVAELVALARAQPGALNYASSGAGSSQHIAGELFQDLAGIRLTHVPYRGSSPALLDLVGGQVQMSLDTLPSILQAIQSGRVRALAIASSRRAALLPDVPTFAELGMPGMITNAWYGVYMQARTPEPVLQYVHDCIAYVLAQPATHERLAALGAEFRPMDRAGFRAFQRAEYDRYAAFIARRQIRIE